MVTTHVILDGLSDPVIAQRLSASWAAAGYVNTVDPAGQCATLSRERLEEADVDVAASIARAFGLELRDRAGATFEAANDLAKLRERMVYEYKSRFATAVVFGLPALALHYLSPVLVGADTGPRAMLYPWLIQMLLVGWMCLAAGWPLWWQAALAARHLRATGDVLTAATAAAAFVPSCVAWVSVLFAGKPWMDEAYFHAAAYAVMLATLQRWLAHRAAGGLSGRTTQMIRGIGRLLGTWLAAMLIAWCVGGWPWGLALGLVMPPLMGLGAVNPWSAGPAAALPVIAFAGAMVFGGESESVVEIAAGFQFIMVMAFAWGWRATSRGAAQHASSRGDS